MGNNNLRRSQLGVEALASPGVAVAATRQLVGALGLVNRPERTLREEYRASMGGSTVYDDLSYRGEGTYSGRCVSSEMIYWLAAGMVSGITPIVVGVTGQLWTFNQPLTLTGTPVALTPLRPLTLYAGDNTQAIRAAGCYVSRLVIRGTDTSAWTAEVTFLTQQVVRTATTPPVVFANLTIPANETMLNALGRLWIDAADAGPIGTTRKDGTVFSFVWTWDSGIAPDYAFGATPDTLDYKDIHRDLPSCTLELTTKWNGNMVTEYDYWRSLGVRLVKLETNGLTDIAGATAGTRNFVRLEGAYVYTDFTPLDSERDGTTLGRATLTAVEDTTTGGFLRKVRVSVQNDVAAL